MIDCLVMGLFLVVLGVGPMWSRAADRNVGCIDKGRKNGAPMDNFSSTTYGVLRSMYYVRTGCARDSKSSSRPDLCEVRPWGARGCPGKMPYCYIYPS